jgi:hypothetical protein
MIDVLLFWLLKKLEQSSSQRDLTFIKALDHTSSHKRGKRRLGFFQFGKAARHKPYRRIPAFVLGCHSHAIRWVCYTPFHMHQVVGTSSSKGFKSSLK